jgi:hypothetical protein
MATARTAGRTESRSRWLQTLNIHPARICASKAVMTVTSLDVVVGLVMLAVLVAIVLAVRRWDD